jgi:hypothetical protein
MCLEEAAAGPPALLVTQDRRPADRGGDLGAVPDIQRQAGPGQPGAELPGPQEAGQATGTGDQVDGLAGSTAFTICHSASYKIRSSHNYIPARVPRISS